MRGASGRVRCQAWRRALIPSRPRSDQAPYGHGRGVRSSPGASTTSPGPRSSPPPSSGLALGGALGVVHVVAAPAPGARPTPRRSGSRSRGCRRPSAGWRRGRCGRAARRAPRCRARNGRRCGARSRVQRPVRSSSSPASAPTGSTDRSAPTTYGLPAVLVSPVRVRTRPSAVRSSSTATARPASSSAPSRRRPVPSAVSVQPVKRGAQVPVGSGPPALDGRGAGEAAAVVGQHPEPAGGVERAVRGPQHPGPDQVGDLVGGQLAEVGTPVQDDRRGAAAVVVAEGDEEAGPGGAAVAEDRARHRADVTGRGTPGAGADHPSTAPSGTPARCYRPAPCSRGGRTPSSTRSTPGASPTRTATASATCPGSPAGWTTSPTSASTSCGCRRSTARRRTTTATTSATTRTSSRCSARSPTSTSCWPASTSAACG